MHADLAQKPQINANLSCPVGRNTSIKKQRKKTTLLSGDWLGWGWGLPDFVSHIRSHYQMDFRIGDGAERQGSGFVEAWGAKGGAFLPV